MNEQGLALLPAHGTLCLYFPLHLPFKTGEALDEARQLTFLIRPLSDLMQKGTVIRSTGSWYNVRLEDGEVIECRIVGKFRLGNLKLTNPIAVGDHVRVTIDNENHGLIKEILPRQNYVVRQSPRKKQFLHLLAANIDQAVVIVTIVQPMLKQGFIDRFLLMTEPYHIPACIVFNKADLYADEDVDMFLFLREIYETIGYTVIITSAEEGDGVDVLKDFLKGKTTLICGQSGVGKSTLVNAVQPGLELRTQELSDYSGKGTHTTTFAEMFPLDTGGYIIDTPGIKTLGFSNLEPMDVAHNFREFFEKSPACKFGGQCLHRNEPKCAVKAAIEEGTISQLRYQNYLAIIEELESQNYWERHEM